MDFQPPQAEFIAQAEEVKVEQTNTLNSLTIFADQEKGKEKRPPKSFNDLDKNAKQEVENSYYQNHTESPIGDASMDKAETIFMRLRRAGNVSTDAPLQYKKGSPHYKNVIDHLGGMKPGDIKLVAPWPDDSPADGGRGKGGK